MERRKVCRRAHECNWNSRLYMASNMRCPKGHTTVYLKGGSEKGVQFLEAECFTCHARQRVTINEVARDC